MARILLGALAGCPCGCKLKLSRPEADIWGRVQTQLWLAILPAGAGLAALIAAVVWSFHAPANLAIVGSGVGAILAGSAAAAGVESRRDAVIRETHRAAAEK